MVHVCESLRDVADAGGVHRWPPGEVHRVARGSDTCMRGTASPQVLIALPLLLLLVAPSQCCASTPPLLRALPRFGFLSAAASSPRGWQREQAGCRHLFTGARATRSEGDGGQTDEGVVVGGGGGSPPSRHPSPGGPFSLIDVELSSRKLGAEAELDAYYQGVSSPNVVYFYCTAWEDDCKALHAAIKELCSASGEFEDDSRKRETTGDTSRMTNASSGSLPVVGETTFVRIPITNSMVIARGPKARKRQDRMLNNMRQFRHHEKVLKLLLDRDVTYGGGHMPALEFARINDVDTRFHVTRRRGGGGENAGHDDVSSDTPAVADARSALREAAVERFLMARDELEWPEENEEGQEKDSATALSEAGTGADVSASELDGRESSFLIRNCTAPSISEWTSMNLFPPLDISLEEVGELFDDISNEDLYSGKGHSPLQSKPLSSSSHPSSSAGTDVAADADGEGTSEASGDEIPTRRQRRQLDATVESILSLLQPVAAAEWRRMKREKEPHVIRRYKARFKYGPWILQMARAARKLP
eukprot:GHVU01028692.1.p1 GENE.GHVU01028692.1~~GHVU01028692.1.p1  ORF type:complete len:533 (+),score=75.12 GHVU01028692.1:364-1962(+)